MSGRFAGPPGRRVHADDDDERRATGRPGRGRVTAGCNTDRRRSRTPQPCARRGSVTAAAVEHARREMLHEVRAAEAHPDRCRRAHGGAHPPGRRRPVQLSRRRDPPALRHPRRLPRDPARPRPPRAGRRRMPPTATRVPPGGSACAWAPAAPVRPTSSPGSPRPSWTPCRSSPSRATCPRALLGKDAFQEIDITGITLPMTKHNYLVRDADDMPRVIAEAFYLAAHGRPGPRSHRHHQGRAAAGDDRRAPHPRRDRRRPAGLPADPRRAPAPAQGRRPRDRAGEATADPGRARGPASPRPGTSCGRSPRRPRSRSPGPCSGSGRWTSSTRSPTATWACTAGSTSTGRSSRPTC